MNKDKLRKLFRKLFDGEAAAPASRRRPRTVLRLEELESRCCPSPFIGGGSGVVWAPPAGTPNYNWSYGPNWQNGVVPAPGVTAIFDGKYNIKCNVDVNTSNPIVLQNSYKATMTIQNGITMGITGYQDVNVGADNFVLAFAGPNAVEDITAGSEVMGNFKWGSGGTTNVNGGNVVIGNGANLQQSTASPMNINGGYVEIGPSTEKGYSTFYLSNGQANITVNSNGQLGFWLPATDYQILVSNEGEGALISNKGTTSLFVGNGADGQAEIDAPLENHALLHADQGGHWVFGVADANGNDLSMDDGIIYLEGGVLLNVSHNYTQTGGTLYILDDAEENLWASNGAAYFNGGEIVFDTPQFTYGTLTLLNVIFSGVEIDMRIRASADDCDRIVCVGGTVCQIHGQSKMVVTADGPVQKGSGIFWTLIEPSKGNTINGDFLPANISLPANVDESATLPNSWGCDSL